VYRYSRGTPRVINAVSDHALLAGYVLQTRVIDSRCVKKAIEQLEGKT
jgi:type II secretory pathway predicted ATPase ExeA